MEGSNKANFMKGQIYNLMISGDFISISFMKPNNEISDEYTIFKSKNEQRRYIIENVTHIHGSLALKSIDANINFKMLKKLKKN